MVQKYMKWFCFLGFYLLTLFFLGCAKVPRLSESERIDADQKAIYQLTEDLIRLESDRLLNSRESLEMQREAAQIAKTLVEQTQKTNEEFKMTGGPIWHNFLIKIGKREKGYCYHWVPELLKALPPYPLKYFVRYWGGSFLSLGRENNGVVFAKRGVPFESGLVYDAWRGVGRPFWKKIKEDKKYRWQERFSEAEILKGEAKVEPK